MSGLLRRLTRRRPATADETGSPTAGSSEPAAAPADTPAEPGGDRPMPAADEQATQIIPPTGEQPAVEQTSPGAEWAKSAVKPAEPEPETPATTQTEATEAQPTPATTDQPTAFAAQRPQGRDLPAGVDPGDLSSGPAASARRGKLRRRLRYLRHVRELLLRDLGGFTYEIHRTAGGTPQESHNKLTAAKAGRIAALDTEVAAIEARLGEPHPAPVLREAGIGGTCPECGELHASDAHYCSRCGAPLDEKARAQRQVAAAAAAAPATASHPTPEPQPASVLWAGGPRPSAGQEPEERPSPTTGHWLGAQPTTLDRAAKPDEDKTGAADAAKPDEAATNVEEPAPTAEPAGDEPVVTPDESAPTAEPAGDEAVLAAEESAPTAEPAGEAVVAADEPARKTEPPSDEPVVAADESAPKAEPAGDEPAPNVDQPVVADDESAPKVEAAGDEPGADEPPAKPKRARASRAKKPAKPAPEAGEERSFEPNGRRDDDVPPPVTSPDPLASQREQGQ